jgi:hypothetical protein
MPAPRVFVSSTCYDLRYIRENLNIFIKGLGFEPVLSEKGNIYYNPGMHVQESVLAEVSNCQLFVLIIGGRFGSKYKDSPQSIVNREYLKAIEEKVPIFAVVEESVYSEYKFYIRNKENKQLIFTEVDTPKIFNFMQEVESYIVNNALFPFNDINELESYLKQQWAGLMYDLLVKRSTYERDAEVFEKLSHLEFLTKQLLNSIGRDTEKINAILEEKISQSELEKIERNMRVKFSSTDVIQSKNLQELFERTSISIFKHANEVELVTGKGVVASVPVSFFDNLQVSYDRLKKELLKALDQFGWSAENFLNQTKPPKIYRKTTG